MDQDLAVSDRITDFSGKGPHSDSWSESQCCGGGPCRKVGSGMNCGCWDCGWGGALRGGRGAARGLHIKLASIQGNRVGRHVFCV